MRECVRCQRVVSASFDVGGGDLCKKCHAQAQLEKHCNQSTPAVVQSLVGLVRSTTGSLGGVKVSLQGLDGHTVTDAGGAFSLGALVTARLVSLAGRLFEHLHTEYPGGCEAWLRRAVARDFPEYEGFFATVLRHSEIGAAIDCATFISLLTRQDVWKRIACSVYEILSEKPDLVLSFSKEGFAPYSLPLAELSASNVEVEMQPVAATRKVDPAEGGALVDPGSGASVTLAPGTRLIYPDGSLSAGEVVVSLAVIDATDIKSLASMPGDFSAIDVRGQAAQLESFGAIWVGLEGGHGCKLQLAEDSPGLTMEVPSKAPVNFERLSEPPTLWEFNDATGKWQQDASVDLAVDGIVLPRAGASSAVVSPSGRQTSAPPPAPPARAMRTKAKGKAKTKAGGEFHSMNFDTFFEGAQNWTPETYQKVFGRQSRTFQLRNIPRAGYWNCDAAYITTFLTGLVVDAHGIPVKAANVWSVGKNYAGASPRSGLGEDGRFSIVAQCRCQIDVYVLLPPNGPQADMLAASPIRLSFGPFQTSEPGETKSLGVLELSRGALVPV